MQLEANPDEVADRTPVACPFCGHDGSFDGQGSWPDEITITRAGVTTTYDVQWMQFRCPGCNGRFQMLDNAEEVDDAS